MTFPLWSAGQLLTADELNNRLASEAVSLIGQAISTTTLTNVDELFVPVRANVTYKVTAAVRYQSVTSTDAKISWTFPAGSSWYYTVWALDVGTTGLAGNLFTHASGGIGGTEIIGGAGAGATPGVWVVGILQVGDTAGNLQLQMAANAAGTLTIASGSTVGAQPVKM